MLQRYGNISIVSYLASQITIKLKQLFNLLWVFLICLQPCFGQTSKLIFEHISSSQGLSQSEVNCIIQDKKGFIWMGTLDGLNRFDGYDMVVYRKSSNNINSYYNGSVIFVTKGGAVQEDSYFKNIKVIYHRVGWHYWDGGRVISFHDMERGNIIKNVQIKNVLIEDPFHAYPPFFFKMTNPSNSNKLCLFQNIIIEDVVQNSPSVNGSMDNSFGKPRNTILKLDDIRKLTNITFKNCFYKVKWITSYEEGDFLKNDYLSNIVFVVNFDVSLSVNDLNGGTASGGGVLNYGESLTVMATPTDGYKFKGWTVNNEMVLENLQYTFNATQNAAIKANFEIFVNNGQAPDTSFKIYPNPASDKLFVNSAGNAVSKIQLIDLTGKVVYSKNEVSQNEMIDLSGFNNGFFCKSIHPIMFSQQES